MKSKNCSTVSRRNFSPENSEGIAKTILDIIVKYLNGGSKFLLKIISVAKLETFLKRDNNRDNHSYFKKFDAVYDKPWLTKMSCT